MKAYERTLNEFAASKGKTSKDLTMEDMAEFGASEEWLKKAKPPGVERYIYFVGCDNYIKIGITQEIEKRIGALQSSNPMTIELLAKMPGDADLEKTLHDVFGRWHHRGEWFRKNDLLEALIDGLNDNDIAGIEKLFPIFPRD